MANPQDQKDQGPVGWISEQRIHRLGSSPVIFRRKGLDFYSDPELTGPELVPETGFLGVVSIRGHACSIILRV